MCIRSLRSVQAETGLIPKKYRHDEIDYFVSGSGGRSRYCREPFHREEFGRCSGGVFTQEVTSSCSRMAVATTSNDPCGGTRSNVHHFAKVLDSAALITFDSPLCRLSSDWSFCPHGLY